MSVESSSEASPGPTLSKSREGVPYHFADITPEQAITINDNFNIVAYGGYHTSVADTIRIHGYCPPGLAEEIDVQCQTASDIVDQLDPKRGDVLFVELAAHDGLPLDLGITNPEIYRQVIENGRTGQRIDPFFYAIALAQLKGIPVMPADITSDTTVVFEQVTGVSVERASDFDSPFHGIFHTLREEQAANTVKDYALGRLPTASDEKPTYVLLLGNAHVNEQVTLLPERSKGIAMAFSRLGLDVQIDFLSDARRDATELVNNIRREQETRIAHNMAPLIDMLKEMRAEDGKSYNL